MKTTERLLAAAKEIWDAYLTHPFIVGIQNGTLAQEKFRYYMVQDLLYLKDYARVFAIGAAKAKSTDTAALFAHYMAVMNDEVDIHRGYMGKLKITQAEIRDRKPALDNISYTSYMLRTAYEDGEAEILAAILSCAYSYEWIAKKILTDAPCAAENNFYGDWIQGYASCDYAEENVILLDTLDALTAQYTEEQLRHLTSIFVVCSRYELMFWQMAWEMRE